MNKKYTYEFVNETVDIEISEDWIEVLENKDREEYNSNKKETRRHLKLDATIDNTEWVKDEKTDPNNVVADKDTEESLMEIISSILTEKQFNAFEKICINRYTEKEYAEMTGISQPVAHKTVTRAKKIIANYLKTIKKQ